MIDTAHQRVHSCAANYCHQRAGQYTVQCDHPAKHHIFDEQAIDRLLTMGQSKIGACLCAVGGGGGGGGTGDGHYTDAFWAETIRMQLRPVYRLVPHTTGLQSDAMERQPMDGQWEARRTKQVAVRRRMSHPKACHPTGRARYRPERSRVYRKEVAVDQSSVQVSSIDLRLGRRGRQLELARHSRAFLTRHISDAEVPPPEDDAPTTRCTSRFVSFVVESFKRLGRAAFFRRLRVRSSGRWFCCCAPTLKRNKKPQEAVPASAVCTCVFAVSRFIISRMLLDDRAAIHRFSPSRLASSVLRFFAATQLSAFVVQSPCADLPYRLTMPKSQSCQLP